MIVCDVETSCFLDFINGLDAIDEFVLERIFVSCTDKNVNLIDLVCRKLMRST